MRTKERILKEALRLFSEKGFNDVYVGDIASAVGIKAPSLYKHFKNKQEIFEAMFEMLKAEYKEQADTIHINGIDNRMDAEIYTAISEETFLQMAQNLFRYFLNNENVKLFRKMLTLEQFKNKELAKLYSKQYIDDVLNYQTSLFSLMIEKEFFREENPYMMALQFYAPIYLLLTMCDREPEREEEVLKLLKGHIRQFSNLYKK